MLLSDKRILEELEHGNIVIEPFDQRQLGTNSYDCRLGEWYFQGDANIEVMHLDNPDEIRLYWGEARQAREGKIAIRSGTTILAHTQEIIGGHNGYLAKMYSRSTVARSGLSVCRCAGVGDVGYISRWIHRHSDDRAFFPLQPALTDIDEARRLAQQIWVEIDTVRTTPIVVGTDEEEEVL